MRALRLSLVVAFALLVAGCKPSRVHVEYICVKLYSYSKGEVQRLGEEIDAIEVAAPTVISWIEDYVVTRDAIKKCLAKKAAAAKKRGKK